MNVEISSFADAGNIQKERVVIKVLKDLDIGDYAVFCSAVSAAGNATSGLQKAYWFPDGTVKSGDLVVLYTKQGNNSTKALDGGGTAYFYYWRQDRALWDGNNGAAILEISEWTYAKSSARSQT
jgi:hypothetical protein